MRKELLLPFTACVIFGAQSFAQDDPVEAVDNLEVAMEQVVTPAEVPAPQSDIVYVEPIVEIIFQTTGGQEVRADWSEQAKTNFENNLTDEFERQNLTYARHDIGDETNEELQQLVLLFETAAQMREISMPHKGKGRSNEKLTLGPSAQLLQSKYGADQALFLQHASVIQSGGMFLTSVAIGAATGGSYVPIFVDIKASTTTLVDLETGDFVQYNRQFGGDARDEEANARITNNMLKDMALQ